MALFSFTIVIERGHNEFVKLVINGKMCDFQRRAVEFDSNARMRRLVDVTH